MEDQPIYQRVLQNQGPCQTVPTLPREKCWGIKKNWQINPCVKWTSYKETDMKTQRQAFCEFHKEDFLEIMGEKKYSQWCNFFSR